MKFDQALREGYNNYVSEDEETISIGRNTLEKIKNILIDKEVVGIAIDRLKKGPDPDNPDFDAAGIAGGEIYFKVDDLLKQPVKDEEEASIELKDDPYDFEADVEAHGAKSNMIGSAFGTSAGRARTAVKQRQALMNKGVDLYHKRTQELSDKMDKALQTKTLPVGKY